MTGASNSEHSGILPLIQKTSLSRDRILKTYKRSLMRLLSMCTILPTDMKNSKLAQKTVQGRKALAAKLFHNHSRTQLFIITIRFGDPVKEEIWATIRAMNDVWAKGSANDLSWFSHHDMVVIAPGRPPASRRRRCLYHELESLSPYRASTAGWRLLGDPRPWRRRRRCLIFHHVARSGGQTIDQQDCDLLFFVKGYGRWWAVSDQFSPYPA